MKTRQELLAERGRLITALEAHRSSMTGITAADKSWLRGMLDEAMLQGQIKAIDYALEPDSGGWPHDARCQFLDARSDAIRSMRAAGIEWDKILAQINLSELQAKLIATFDDPEPKN
jgi:hypothetical protein